MGLKIIHCADLHLGSKLESKFSRDISDIRKREILYSFSRLVEFANANEVKIILLSGDVFDKDKPAIKDKEYFYKIILANPNIDFIYLNGNHDKEGSFSENDIPNLKTFNKNDFISFDYGDVTISGIEICPENAKSFYAKIVLNPNKKNIVMLHGDVSDSVGVDKIKISNLKNKNIDYLALGHIHSFKEGIIDERGRYAFPGCLEGRGFDECGEKGFILLKINSDITYDFIPFAKRVIHEIEVDVSSSNDMFDIRRLVKEKTNGISKEDILRINLIGELPLNIEVSEEDIAICLEDFFFVNVKNKTSLKISIDDYRSDKSLIGEFVRNVLNNDDYNEEDKKALITMGLRVINGKEIE